MFKRSNQRRLKAGVYCMAFKPIRADFQYEFGYENTMLFDKAAQYSLRIVLFETYDLKSYPYTDIS